MQIQQNCRPVPMVSTDKIRSVSADVTARFLGSYHSLTLWCGREELAGVAGRSKSSGSGFVESMAMNEYFQLLTTSQITRKPFSDFS